MESIYGRRTIINRMPSRLRTENEPVNLAGGNGDRLKACFDRLDNTGAIVPVFGLSINLGCCSGDPRVDICDQLSILGVSVSFFPMSVVLF